MLECRSSQCACSLLCFIAGSSMVGAYGDSQGVQSMLGGLWASITLEAPPLSEQFSILLGSFPTIHPDIVATGIAVLHLCQQAAGFRDLNPASLSEGWCRVVQDAMGAASLGFGELASAFGRHFSLRDMFKLCRRLQVRFPDRLPHTTSHYWPVRCNCTLTKMLMVTHFFFIFSFVRSG